MKVLWFSNTPGLANEFLNTNNSLKTGSWMNLINEKMAENVDLYVVYPGKEDNSFTYKNTNFHQIKMHKRTIIQKLLNRIVPLPTDIEFITNKALEKIEQIKPDIIHVFGTELPWGLVQNSTKIPVIISIQGNLTVISSFYFRGISSIDIIRFAKLKAKKDIYFQYKRFKKNDIYERKILTNSKYIIGRTDWDRRITSVLAPNAKYYYNEETLRNSFYKTKWKKPNSDAINLFTISSGVTYKGLETIVKTAKLLDQLKINFKWNVAGLNRKSTIVQVLQKKNGISRNINLIGVIDENEINSQMNNSHIYIMPSHIENGSIALSEAMITGIPVITTLAGGTSSRLEDGKEGLMIQSGDPYSMAGSIIEMRDNYDKATEMGAMGRKCALKRHDVNDITTQLLSIYEEIFQILF